MNTPSILFAIAGTMTAVASQHIGRTDTHSHSDFVRHGLPLAADDGTPDRRIDPSAYATLPMPQYRAVRLPPGFRNRLVAFDTSTGTGGEVDEIPLPPLAAAAHTGERPPGVEEEPLPESWGSLQPLSSSSYPWSTQVRVFFRQGNLHYVASGTLVDQRHVITAGHCVHAGPGGGWSTEVRIVPAYDGTEDAFGGANGTTLASTTGWTQNGSFDYDIGWIRLDRPVGALTGTLGYAYNTASSYYYNRPFRMVGYPGTNPCWSGSPNQMFTATGTMDVVGTYSLRANTPWNCSVGGMSGSACYYTDASSNHYVHGALSNEHTGYAWIQHTRMVQSYFDFMTNQFFPAGYPAQFDLVALDATAAPSGGVAVGSALSSFTYLVNNSSLADPPSLTFTANVYLSTNPTISTADTLIQQHTFTWDFAPKSSVRVNVTQPPAIPPATLNGNYWVGVIVSYADVNPSNNITSGWDAAAIQVNTQPTATAYGVACGRASKAFYERFPSTAEFDLSPSSMQLVKAADFYIAQPGTAYVAPTAAAVVLPLANDAEIAVPLAGMQFPFLGGSTSTLWVCSNGYVSAGPGNPTTPPGGPSNWLSAVQPRWGCWHDFDPSASGSGPVRFEQVGTVAYVTWDGVLGRQGTDISTWQLQFDLTTGNVNYAWQSVQSISGPNRRWFVGYVAAAPNENFEIDISAALPGTFRTSADNASNLSLSSTPPQLGTTAVLTTSQVPASSPLGIQILGTTRLVPALALAASGMPDCYLNVSPGLAALIVPIAGQAAFPLTIPYQVNLIGGHVTGQSMVLVHGVNAAGIVASNGIDLRIGMP